MSSADSSATLLLAFHRAPVDSFELRACSFRRATCTPQPQIVASHNQSTTHLLDRPKTTNSFVNNNGRTNHQTCSTIRPLPLPSLSIIIIIIIIIIIMIIIIVVVVVVIITVIVIVIVRCCSSTRAPRAVSYTHLTLPTIYSV